MRVLTFNNTNSTECRLDPSGTHQPFLNIGNDGSQILRIRFHNAIEFDKFPGPEKHFRDAKLEIFVVQFQRMQHCLKTSERMAKIGHWCRIQFVRFCSTTTYLTECLWFQTYQLWRQIRFVHVVQFGKRYSRRITVLHQFQHRRCAGTIQLSQRKTAVKLMVDHFAVRFYAANEIRTLSEGRVLAFYRSVRPARNLHSFPISPSIRPVAFWISTRRKWNSICREMKNFHWRIKLSAADWPILEREILRTHAAHRCSSQWIGSVDGERR